VGYRAGTVTMRRYESDSVWFKAAEIDAENFILRREAAYVWAFFKILKENQARFRPKTDVPLRVITKADIPHIKSEKDIRGCMMDINTLFAIDFNGKREDPA